MFRFNYNSNDHMMILHVDKNFSKLYLVYSSRLMFCEKIRKGQFIQRLKYFREFFSPFPGA